MNRAVNDDEAALGLPARTSLFGKPQRSDGAAKSKGAYREKSAVRSRVKTLAYVAFADVGTGVSIRETTRISVGLHGERSEIRTVQDSDAH